MKKLASVFLLTLGICANARQITPGEAMTLASDFMNNAELQSVSPASKTLRPMRAPGVDTDAPASPYYVFNRGEADGFVIISGDDRAPKILGYSDKGTFDADNLPPQLKAMMEQWATYVTRLSETAPQHASWSNSVKTRAGEGILLKTAEWGQNAPFNDLCPTVDGQKAPAGCVATAMAIAMKYHNWPDCTRGGIEEDYYCPSEKFDFDNYSIDWNALSENNNPDFAKEAANLTYSAGIASQMTYGPYESGTYSWTIGHLLNYFYAYDKECQVVPREKFDDQEWDDMLKSQLQTVGPVIYFGGGVMEETPGHCFVVDGYDLEGLYHVNWGWDGGSNGYFTLDFSLDGGLSFGEVQGMVINMKPDREKKQYSRAWLPNCEVFIGGEVNGWNFENPNIVEGERQNILTPAVCISEFVGYIGLGIVDEDDTILKLVKDSFNKQDGTRTNCAFPGSPFFGFNDLKLPKLSKGERFQLISCEDPDVFIIIDGQLTNNLNSVPSDNISDWSLVTGGIVHPSYFYENGNRSEISEVRVHLNENLPSFFTDRCTYDRELTVKCLKGSACPLHISVPKKGVKLDVKAADKEGNPVEALYVGESDEYENNHIGLNISVYADQYDVYVKYEDSGDTRRDSGLPMDQIVEKDGLVYRKLADGLELIGYDSIEDTVIIPATISVDGTEMPVISIAELALAYAPMKHVVINTETLSLADFAFVGTTQLESVSAKDLSILTETYLMSAFFNSGIKKVYLDSDPRDYKILAYTTGYIFSSLSDGWTAAVGVKDIDFVVSGLPDAEHFQWYFSGLRHFQQLPGSEKVAPAYRSYLIPGLGNTDILYEPDFKECPIKQMWTYEIDKPHHLISIKDILSNVSIDKVIINGIMVEGNNDSLYEIPVSDSNSPDILVEYTVDGFKKMTTHYSPVYNSNVEDIRLRPFVGGDSNGDGIVNIADAVNVANYIIGLATTDFDFECSDINEDGEISVSDVTSTIALIPLQSYANRVIGSRSNIKEYHNGYMVANSQSGHMTDLYLKSDEAITALQFDLTVANGTAFPAIQLAENVTSTHTLQSFTMNANTLRVVVYSATGNLLNTGLDDSFLSIIGLASDNNLSIENIYGSGTNGRSITLEFDEGNIGNGVSGLTIAKPTVESANGNVTVKNVAGVPIIVYSLDGVCVGKYETNEDSIDISLSQGLYIVTVGTCSYRVINR